MRVQDSEALIRPELSTVTPLPENSATSQCRLVVPCLWLYVMFGPRPKPGLVEPRQNSQLEAVLGDSLSKAEERP